MAGPPRDSRMPHSHTRDCHNQLHLRSLLRAFCFRDCSAIFIFRIKCVQWETCHSLKLSALGRLRSGHTFALEIFIVNKTWSQKVMLTTWSFEVGCHARASSPLRTLLLFLLVVGSNEPLRIRTPLQTAYLDLTGWSKEPFSSYAAWARIIVHSHPLPRVSVLSRHLVLFIYLHLLSLSVSLPVACFYSVLVRALSDGRPRNICESFGLGAYVLWEAGPVVYIVTS